MFAADLLQDALPDQVGAELGQGPTPVRQAEIVRGCPGQPPDRLHLGAAQTRRGTRSARLANRVQPLLLEGMQIGVGGVDMDLQEAGDVHRGNPGRVKQKGFGPATLPGL